MSNKKNEFDFFKEYDNDETENIIFNDEILYETNRYERKKSDVTYETNEIFDVEQACKIFKFSGKKNDLKKDEKIKREKDLNFINKKLEEDIEDFDKLNLLPRKSVANIPHKKSNINNEKNYLNKNDKKDLINLSHSIIYNPISNKANFLNVNKLPKKNDISISRDLLVLPKKTFNKRSFSKNKATVLLNNLFV